MGEVYVGRRFRTEYVGKVSGCEDLAAEIISAGKILDDAGLTPENAGNISAKTADGMLITVGGKNKGELTTEDVVEVVGFDSETAKVRGLKEPSSEVPMHWLIYQGYPNVCALVHAHDELAVEHVEVAEKEFGAEVTKETAHYGTEDQAGQVADAFSESNYVVIRDHGVICAGKTVGEATDLLLRCHKGLAEILKQ